MNLNDPTLSMYEIEMCLNNLTPLKFQIFQQYRFSDIQCSYHLHILVFDMSTFQMIKSMA